MALDTGDLLLFKGRGLDSCLVGCLTYSTWTHAGLVWVNPPDVEPGTYVLECNVTDSDDGVQLRPLPQYLQTYNGSVWVRKFHSDRALPFFGLSLLYLETEPCQYAFFPPDVIRAIGAGGCDYRSRQVKYFVCSSYIAYVWKRMGYLSATVDWTTIRPKDLVDDRRLEWVDCKYDKVMRLL